MRAVNLLPEENRPGRMPTVLTKNTVVGGGGAALAVVLLLFGFMFFQSHGKVSDKSDTLSALQQQLTQVQAAAARSAAQQGVDQSRVAAFTTAASGRMPWDNLLDDLSRVLPAGSWLSSLSMQSGTPAVTGAPVAGAPVAGAPLAVAPTSFTVSGIAFTEGIVAQVMDRLELVPALSGVTLQSSTKTTVGNTNAYTFTMSANVEPTQVPQ
jgi:Tfp pilus assembly protein PilN